MTKLRRNIMKSGMKPTSMSDNKAKCAGRSQKLLNPMLDLVKCASNKTKRQQKITQIAKIA
jgi:hypothetical protein